MTPTPAQISKKLEAALKKASPKELARIMRELERPAMDRVFAGEATGFDSKTEAQLTYIRDNFVLRLPIQEWIEYRNEIAHLSELDLLYRLQVRDIDYLEALIISAENFVFTLDYLEEGFFSAGYELGEDETRAEDLETSPLKRYRDAITKRVETSEERLRETIKRRAQLCLSSTWKDLGRPCPFDPAYDSPWAQLQAKQGQPVPGSKELPLDPEEALAAEQARDAAKAEKAKKPRRKKAST